MHKLIKSLAIYLVFGFFCWHFSTVFAADDQEKTFDKATRKELALIDELIGTENFQSALKHINPLLAKQSQIPKLHLIKANILSLLKDNQTALDYFSTEIDKQPDNTGLIAARAQFLLSKGYLESAREEFYRVYEKDYRPVEVLSVLADIEREKGHIVNAIKFIDQALEINSEADQLWFKKAELELKLAQVEEAKRACYQATKLAPDQLTYHKLYIEILIYLKERQELQNHVKTVYKLFPTDPWITLRMSSLLVEERNLKGAEEILIKAAKENPKEQLLMFQLATILAGERNWEGAIRYFQMGLEEDPSNAWALIQLAKIYLQTGQANPAIEYLEKARENETHDPFVYETLARIYNRQNDTFEAERVILEGLAINDKNQELILEYASLLEKRGKNKETTKAYEEALRNDPDNSFILGKLGNLYRAAENYDQSVAVLKKAIELDPKATWIRSYYIETLDEMEKWDQALAEIEKLLKIMPNDYWAYAKRALIQFETELLDEAYQSVSRAIRLRPDADWLKEIEGRILEGLKKYNLAEQAFQKALTKSPGDSRILTRLAYVQVHIDKSRALQTIRKSLNSDDFDIGTIELYLYLSGKVEQYWGFERNGPEREVYQQIIFKEFAAAQKGIARLKEQNNPHQPFLAYFWNHMKHLNQSDGDLPQDASLTLESAWHFYYLGVDAVSHDEYEKAREYLEKAKDMFADNPWLTVKLAYVLQHLKLYPQAVDLLNQFLRLEKDGDYMWVLLRLALNYDLSNEFNDSERIYKQILEKNPKDNVALNNLAWMYLNATDEKMHKLDDALKLALKAVEIQPSSANLDTLAEAYFQKKDYNKALKAIEQALDRDRRGLDDFKKTKKKILRAMEASETR